MLNEQERKALVEEMNEKADQFIANVEDIQQRLGIDPEGDRIGYPGETVHRLYRHIIALERLLAERDVDELLDSVHEGACIRNMYSHKGRSSVTVGVPIERTSGGWSGYIEHIATGPTRMDAIRNAVAQATTTQEGASDE